MPAARPPAGAPPSGKPPAGEPPAGKHAGASRAHRGRRVAAVLLASLAAAAFLWPLLHLTLEPDGHRLIDFEVYRTAARELLHGRPLYDFRTPQDLPFTYPPVAAWLAVPLALVPAGVAGVLWTFLNLALLAVLLATVLRPTVARLHPAAWPIAFALLVSSFPARDNLVLGQVNIVLAALVLLDCALPRTRWPRGLLVGVATAVKLTPGLFVPYLWLSGRRRAAWTAALTFAGLVAVTWLALPRDSSRYWLREMWDPQRIGRNDRTENQSVRGLLLHLGVDGLAAAAVGGALLLAVLVLVLRRAPALSRAGDELAALAVVGLGTNLLSPVTWVHHTVWFFLAVAVLVDDWRDRRRARWGLALAALVTYKTTIFFGARLVRQHDGLLDLAGRLVESSYVLAALALVALLPARRRLTGAGPAPAPEVPGPVGARVPAGRS